MNDLIEGFAGVIFWLYSVIFIAILALFGASYFIGLLCNLPLHMANSLLKTHYCVFSPMYDSQYAPCLFQTGNVSPQSRTQTNSSPSSIQVKPTAKVNNSSPNNATRVQPTAIPANTSTPAKTCANVNSLRLGCNAITTTTDSSALRVRRTTSTSSKSNILERLDPGTVVKLLEGPFNANGYVWWKIQTPSGTIGYAVQSADGIRTLTPYNN